MKSREYKDSVFQNFASIAQAFSSPKRLEIIDVLAQGERDVLSLTKEVHTTIANTSQHLKILKSVRLVESRKSGVQIFYRLADDQVLSCWKGLQALAEKRIAEVKEVTRLFFEERGGMETIARDELQERIKDGDVILLDVRPVEEYQNGHLPDAVSIPISELSQRLDEIPEECEVVSYCRGPYCVLSAEAVVILRNSGRKAWRLEEGFPEWKEAGLPVKTYQ